MPTSTEKGFLTGKWELKYLKRRFRAHRNQVAAAKPVIDSKMPITRPHVIYKLKKAVCEERRQDQILIENFRILKKTTEIMGDTENIICFSSTNMNKPINVKCNVHFYNNNNNTTKMRDDSGHVPKKDKSMTSITKKNYHIIHGWFQLKFGKYIPWWAQINY